MSTSSRTDTPKGLDGTVGHPVHWVPKILPHERVFPVQIGSELFKLSGASISSDAPSYFSQYFKCQLEQAEEAGRDPSTSVRTLYIDRDPTTFRDISLHLQGYHLKPRDSAHFVRLFADAQFYHLPKLISQLYEESIYINIGGREFEFPRDSFSGTGNSPNYFTLGFAIFFSAPDDTFPGLGDSKDSLIRPPSIVPPSVPNRSADIFEDLTKLLRGYPMHIRDDEHRAALLRDCRYFNFKGLEQKLIPHDISYNQIRRRHEITLRIEDILKSGISVVDDNQLGQGGPDSLSAWVHYARPYEDEQKYELVLEIGGENTKIYLGNAGSSMRAEFFGHIKTRITRLFEVIATKLNLPPSTQPLGLLMASGGASSQPPTPGNTTLSEDLVRVVIEPETYVLLDGKPYHGFSVEGGGGAALADDSSSSAMDMSGISTSLDPGNDGGRESPASSLGPTTRKRRRVMMGGGGGGGGDGTTEEWVVRTGQWRLRIQESKHGKSAVECVLVAAKLDAYSSELARNAQRGFLRG